MVANEAIAGGLALLLGLPIPPNGIALSNERPFYFSANFGVDIPRDEFLTGDGAKPFESDWQSVINKHLEVAWGILLFDFWISNPDRAPINLAYSVTTNQFMIFDHGACLYRGAAKGKRSLKNQIFKVDINRYETPHKNPELSGKPKSPFVRFLNTSTGIEQFYDRIQSIPKWQIQDVVFSVEGVGYSQDECSEVFDFLLRRRSKLYSMVYESCSEFGELPETEAKKIRELAKAVEEFKNV